MEKFFTNIFAGEKGLYCRQPKLVIDYAAEYPVCDDDGTLIGYDYGRKEIPGKYCFPVKSCMNQICPGLAHITIVKDMPNHAFFTAEMVRYELPTEQVLVEYLRRHSEMWWHTMTINRNGLKGSYVKLVNPRSHRTRYLAAGNSGNVKEIQGDFFGNDGSQTETIEVSDYIFQHYHGVSVTNMMEGIVGFKYEAIQSNCSDAVVSLLLEDAYDWKVIDLREISGVTYSNISISGMLDAVDQFSLDEFLQIVAEVSDINTKANAAIENKIRKGKLPFRIQSDGKCSIGRIYR